MLDDVELTTETVYDAPGVALPTLMPREQPAAAKAATRTNAIARKFFILTLI